MQYLAYSMVLQIDSISQMNQKNTKNHATKKCKLFCEQCSIPICAQCIYEQHYLHYLVGIFDLETF